MFDVCRLCRETVAVAVICVGVAVLRVLLATSLSVADTQGKVGWPTSVLSAPMAVAEPPALSLTPILALWF